MIGSQLVEELCNTGYDVIGVGRSGNEIKKDKYCFIKTDLADKEKLRNIVEENNVDRIIHLAALAHPEGEKDLSWERYKAVNVDCAKNVFEVAGDRPVLFISTVDVYGFYNGKEPVNGNSPIRPVSNYGKSKAMAEEECKKLKYYSIFRLSPVYTSSITRDIQKRYYLKYPMIAYQVGKGTSFEILNVKKAVDVMVHWCEETPQNDIHIIKDAEMMWTPDYIQSERKKGNAIIKLWFPRWAVYCGYVVLKGIIGENKKTYLLNKAVYPLRSCSDKSDY